MGRLTRLDAFSKTAEDARVRTTSGGIVTLCSIVIVFFLVVGEIRDYRTTHIHPELVVDKSRGEQLPININITFPHLPCSLITLDIMDVSGEQQTGITHGIELTRLTPHPASQPVSTERLVPATNDVALHLSPDYCGECYGAASPPKCCNTCADVRDAYATVGWAFGAGEGVEQCEREHYGENLAAMREEGCNLSGHLRVNKVIGNFHIAPGRSFSAPQVHLHDLAEYFKSPKEHTFAHIIHHLSFGPDLPAAATAATAANANPLDGTSHWTVERGFNYMYFIKVVSTAFHPLRGGGGSDGGAPLETHQFSVTSHERSLSGGNDGDHPSKLHAQGGIPGVFFSYDISPMKVINREVRERTFLGLLTGICAIVGGTLTVATVVDRGVYEGGMRMKKKMHSG